MYERIKKLYNSGKLSKSGVRNAVIKNLITAEEYKAITNEEYTEDITEETECFAEDTP